MERRLAAILAADVVGYSRLMEVDEEATLAGLKAHRAELIDPMIAERKGRIVKLMGDGALVEFASVVDAVQCAVDIQRAMAERNAAVPQGRRIEFRIGINIGDVIVDGDDIYGDGVNVAARLEGLAEPGGVCISHAVHTQVCDKLPLAFEDLGEIEIKNLARSVGVFRIAAEAAAGRPASTTVALRMRRWRWPIVAAVLLVLASTAAVVGWMPPWGVKVAPSPATRSGQTGIAVLPFDNLSGDPEQGYFSDGITEDVITGLSRISGLFVIARTTMLTYRGRGLTVHEVGRELDVPFVLEGSVRRSGDQIRVNAQLIEVANERHLWAERYDREMTDVFALQDEITQKIVAALAVNLTKEETERLNQAAKANPEAYDTLLRGLALLRRYTPDTVTEARAFFEKAIAFDPGYARAYAAIAYSLALDVIFGWSTAPEADIRRALTILNTAVELDETVPQVHFARSNVYRVDRRLDEAIAAAQRAIELDPNYADAYATLAVTLNYAGRPQEGMAAIRKSMRLDPRYSFFHLWILAQAHFLLERYEEAVGPLQAAIERNPGFVQAHKLLAATYGQMGDIGNAEWEAEEVLALLPSFSLETERKWAPYESPGLDLYIEGLRKAGLPE